MIAHDLSLIAEFEPTFCDGITCVQDILCLNYSMLTRALTFMQYNRSRVLPLSQQCNYLCTLYTCIQDALSSRARLAFRPSARAIKGILHTICTPGLPCIVSQGKVRTMISGICYTAALIPR